MYANYPYYIPLVPSQSMETVVPFDNNEFAITLEQGDYDKANINEGVKVTDVYFNPDLSEKNQDGTYKRIIYNQIKNSFYGFDGCKDFTKLFGLENIDLVLDGKNRVLYDTLRVLSIPQIYFGDKIVEKSVKINETSGEQSYTIIDDGNGNLQTKENVFSVVVSDNNNNLMAFHSSSIITVDNSGILIDGISNNDINWVYNLPQYLFFKKSQIKNFKLSHDIFDETPPFTYESNLCYVGTPLGGSTYNLNYIPSSSYTVSSSMLGEFVKIECGIDYVMVSDKRNTITCWGDVVYSTYGSHSYTITDFASDLKDFSVGDHHSIFLKNNGEIRLWEGSDSTISASYSFNNIESGRYKLIASGPSGSILIQTNEEIVGFGTSNIFDSSSILQVTNIVKVAVGENHVMLLDASGSIHLWGSNQYNQLEIPSIASGGVIDIACGDNHNVVLLSDGRVVSWGSNFDNQSSVPFGITIDDWGNTFRIDSPIVATVGLSNIISVQAKHNNTCVFKDQTFKQLDVFNDDGIMVCWGNAGLISKYKVLKCGMGYDFSVLELDNDYQSIMYLPSFKYPNFSHLLYNDGTSSYSSSINFLREGEYNSFNIFVSKPKLSTFSVDKGPNVYLFNSEQVSKLNNEARDYISISLETLVNKLNLSNLQNSYFYVKQVAYNFFVEEKSGYRLNCNDVNDIYYFANNVVPSGSYTGNGILQGTGSMDGTGSFYGTGSFTGFSSLYPYVDFPITGSFVGTGSFTGTGSFDGSGSFIGSGSFSPSLNPSYFVEENSSDIYLAYEALENVYYFADNDNNQLYLVLDQSFDNLEVEHLFSNNLNNIEGQQIVVNVPVETFDNRSYLSSYSSELNVPFYFIDEGFNQIFITDGSTLYLTLT